MAAMTADLRALDAECAQKVMGWEHTSRIGMSTHCWYEYGEHVAHDNWSPTTDIRAAWTLLEKLVADGAVVQLRGYGSMWYASTDRVPGGTAKQFIAGTAPLAIVRMALAVKR